VATWLVIRATARFAARSRTSPAPARARRPNSPSARRHDLPIRAAARFTICAAPWLVIRATDPASNTSPCPGRGRASIVSAGEGIRLLAPAISRPAGALLLKGVLSYPWQCRDDLPWPVAERETGPMSVDPASRLLGSRSTDFGALLLGCHKRNQTDAHPTPADSTPASLAEKAPKSKNRAVH